MLATARAPVIFAGCGVDRAGANQALLAVAERLGLNAAELGGAGEHPLAFVAVDDWSMAWQQAALAQAALLAARATALGDCLAALGRHLGLLRPLQGRGQPTLQLKGIEERDLRPFATGAQDVREVDARTLRHNRHPPRFTLRRKKRQHPLPLLKFYAKNSV